jgi:Helix-turn-helix domain
LEAEELISLSEAAAISGMTRQHMALLARRGALKAVRVGKSWVTTRAAVEDYLGDAEKRSRDPFKKKR